MQQIDKYKILDVYHKSPGQVIYMGISALNQQDVVLVNHITDQSLMGQGLFEMLVRDLSNVAYYADLNPEGYAMVTTYNEGTPLKTFMKNYSPDFDFCKQVFLDILLKCSDYDPLPETLKNILIHEDQMIVSQSSILLNEVLYLDRIHESLPFRTSLFDIAHLIFDDLKDPCIDTVFDYLSSSSFLSGDSLRTIYKKVKHMMASGANGNPSGHVTYKDEEDPDDAFAFFQMHSPGDEDHDKSFESYEPFDSPPSDDKQVSDTRAVEQVPTQPDTFTWHDPSDEGAKADEEDEEDWAHIPVDKDASTLDLSDFHNLPPDTLNVLKDFTLIEKSSQDHQHLGKQIHYKPNRVARILKRSSFSWIWAQWLFLALLMVAVLWYIFVPPQIA